MNQVKRCSKCDIEKEIEMFYKDKSSKDGHRSNCSACSRKYLIDTREMQKEYRDKNKDKISEKSRLDYALNIDKKRKKSKKYYELNSEKVKNTNKKYYENNKQKKLKYQKEYQKNNREKRNLQLVERRKNDPLFRLITNIRNLINNSFYEMSYSKKSRTQEILGCSFDELKIYLESKFESWMTWENRGLYTGEFNDGWDIDHIIPLSSANSEEELIKLNHYTNLQPLCSKINRDIKKNNIEYGSII